MSPCRANCEARGFIDGDLDYLAMGDFLAEGKNAQTQERVLIDHRVR